MNRTDKFTLTLALTLVFSMLFFSFDSFAGQCAAVREETLRLHIIADSDREEAQRLKLLVRDALLEEYSPILCESGLKQALHAARFLREDMRLTAKRVLAENNCFDEVAVNVVRMFFDTKSYDDGVTLPAGEYWAVRVVIGEGKGHNWWCVIYPPLCLPAAKADSAKEAEQDIRKLERQSAYRAKFAVVEIIESLREQKAPAFCFLKGGAVGNLPFAARRGKILPKE